MASAEATDARTSMDVLFEVSNLLNTALDRDSLSICVSLCEAGVNPEALAAVVKELRRERAAGQLAAQSASITDDLQSSTLHKSGAKH